MKGLGTAEIESSEKPGFFRFAKREGSGSKSGSKHRRNSNRLYSWIKANHVTEGPHILLLWNEVPKPSEGWPRGAHSIMAV